MEHKQWDSFGAQSQRGTWKDEQKASAAEWTNPPPTAAPFPATHIQPSIDAFFAAPAQAQSKHVSGEGMQSPQDSTLPHFDAFGSAMAPAAQTYQTPFDSPDPGIVTAEAVGTGLPVLGVDLEEEEIRPRPQRTASLPAVAFDADSIFHMTKASPRSQNANSSGGSGSSSKPKAKKKAAPSALDTSATPQGLPPKGKGSMPDVVFEGIIPEIVSSSALLSRRASEPTLGSRRAAEAARLAAAEAAAAAAGPGAAAGAGAGASSGASRTPAQAKRQLAQPPGVPRRLSIKTETLDTAKASNINLDPLSLASPVTPRRSCSLCAAPAFASDFCATHLTQHMEPATPTSIIRRVHGLWSKQVEQTPTLNSTSRIKITWRFWKRAQHYVVTLCEDTLTGDRSVLVNGKTNYRSRPTPGFWKLSMVLGRSKSSAFEVLVEATPRSQLKGTGSAHIYPGEYEFEIWIDGFYFAEAHNNFLSELGAAQMVAMQQAEAEEGDDDESAGKGAGAAAAASSGSQPRRSIKAAHYDALHYISTHWSRNHCSTKTRLGYVKNQIAWRFTLLGRQHSLLLLHSERSGKRSITLDGKLLFTHKPNWINGLLLQRSSSQRMDVDGVKIEVRIQKLDWSSAKTPAGSSSSSSSGGVGSARPGFAYDLIVGGVPYNKCIKTLPEWAGGMMDVEAKLREQQIKAARKAKRERELQRDPRTVLSPE